ncbi:IS1380 family transposase [Paracraurococcus ruber]|uniref:IS1380 family transposase n=1 Tax=Paracraurococcus ruber TaxID=77675 RepID=A0ABS1D3H4_9PROT|nr:IS1380 family transposase [Paracraurococcus ruber]MBK1661403.1 IS1380 family transposase [Paracraurococcus ruber]TDG29478.1 IS1380 family transposase [Paracraurococcus ruber]
MPVKVENAPPLPGLSRIGGKSLVARFDGGQLSSDGGVLALREIERRLCIADRLAACLDDPRAPAQVTHRLADTIRFRLFMIAAGYEDGNDATALRHDPAFKLALDRLPEAAALCSQPTISRLENLPDTRGLVRMARAMVALFCASFRQVPKRIVLGIDDTFDPVHGEQQMRLFNAYHDGYGFQPLLMFDDEGRPVTAMLRPARRPSGVEARAFLRRLVREIRSHWPRVEILLRGDSHVCTPEVLEFCRQARLGFILGVATSSTLRQHVLQLEQSTMARQAARPGDGKLRRYKAFLDGARSWSRVERIMACVEAGPLGTDTRFVVTSLAGGSPRMLYEDLYCQRGQAENHIKAWKLNLAADRTSCCWTAANQFRLMPHTGAYWLFWSMRSLMPKRSPARAGRKRAIPSRLALNRRADLLRCRWNVPCLRLRARPRSNWSDAPSCH